LEQERRSVETVSGRMDCWSKSDVVWRQCQGGWTVGTWSKRDVVWRVSGRMDCWNMEQERRSVETMSGRMDCWSKCDVVRRHCQGRWTVGASVT